MTDYVKNPLKKSIEGASDVSLYHLHLDMPSEDNWLLGRHEHLFSDL